MFLSNISIHSCIIILLTVEKNICPYCFTSLQAFSTEQLLKCHIKDCFKINGKQKILMPKKGEYVKFKDYGKK